VANDLNQCQFIGRLGKDPETKFLPNGGQVTNISIACGSSWTDKSSGQKQEKTDWIPVVFFGKLAEIAGQYLTKGSKIFVSGNFKTRKWQDQSGQDRYTTEIVVDGFSGVMQMLDSKGDGQGQQQSQQQGYQQPAPQPQQQYQQPQQQYQQPMQQQAPAPANRQNPNNALPPADQYNQQHPHGQQQMPPGSFNEDQNIPF